MFNISLFYSFITFLRFSDNISISIYHPFIYIQTVPSVNLKSGKNVICCFNHPLSFSFNRLSSAGVSCLDNFISTNCELSIQEFEKIYKVVQFICFCYTIRDTRYLFRTSGKLRVTL